MDGVATLCAAQGSYFDVLFSGRWQQASLTDEGEVFLDRDGEVSSAWQRPSRACDRALKVSH